MNDFLSRQPAIANAWHVFARTADFDGPVARRYRVLNRDFVAWRAPGGELVAAPDRCPHREAPLSEGTVVDGQLVCCYHGWTFGDEGRCVAIPSSKPGVPAPPRAHLTTYAVREQYGLAWICVGTPASDLPVIAEDADPAYRRINTDVEHWTSSSTRMVDNFLDITHFPYVHLGTFGGAQSPEVPKLDLEPLDDSWYGYRYGVEARNTMGGATASGQTETVVHRSMSTGFSLPFLVRSTIGYDTGLNHILLLCSTPVDDVNSYFTVVIWRNDDFAVPADEIVRFDLAIGAEDKLMLERVPGLLPLDQTTLVSVQADKCSVEWRRRLNETITAFPGLAGRDEPLGR